MAVDKSPANAYRKSAGLRGPRAQEADLFHIVNARLRRAQNGDTVASTRALADDRLLWITLMDLVRDPANRLPLDTKAAILSVGHTVRRELDAPAPDLTFLINVNEHFAAGLSGS